MKNDQTIPTKERGSNALEIEQMLRDDEAAGRLLGAQFVIMRGEEFLVDLAVGYANPGKTIAVEKNTLFPVFSTGKAFISTAALRMVERGELALDAPVRELWPEFACAGKETTLIRDIFRHRSGVCQRPHYDFIEQIANWNVMRRRVEDAQPEFPPGSNCKYQSVNFTWLLGELMMRADPKKRNLRQIINEEAILPYSKDEIYFGIDDKAESRVAMLVRGASKPPIPPDAPCWDFSLEEIMNNAVIRRACLPGFNCIANAQGLAKHFSALLEGKILGNTLLKEAHRQTTPQAHYGLGYFVTENGHCFGHCGYGGSLVMADERTGLVGAFTCNLMDSYGKEVAMLLDMISPEKTLLCHRDEKTGQ